MNYYRRYSGDYLRDTARLSLTEHGAYTLLMDYYYSDEKPLPLDHEELFRMVRAMTPQDRAAVEKVLDLYFSKRVDGYHQKRIDHEIEVAKSAKANGKRGGRPRTGRQTGSETETVTENETRAGTGGITGDDTGISTGEGGGLAHPPTTNHQPPSTTPQPPSSSPADAGVSKRVASAPDCPHEKIIEIYERICTDLPAVAKWTPTRKGYLQSRWREDKRHQTLEFWERFFGYVHESDFLCGRKKGRNGDKPFKADLEWLITQGNFVKILERRYENE